MNALTLSELLRWGNAHVFVFGFRRWGFLGFCFIFPSFDAFASTAPQVAGCRRPELFLTSRKSFCRRRRSQQPFSWSALELRNFWVVGWRGIIRSEADLPPSPPEMMDHHLLHLKAPYSLLKGSPWPPCCLPSFLWTSLNADDLTDESWTLVPTHQWISQFRKPPPLPGRLVGGWTLGHLAKTLFSPLMVKSLLSL